MIKVAMIGAGSVVFSRNLTGDILSYPEFHKATISYMDVDADRLETAAALCAKTARARGATPKIETTFDRRAALAGADFVINMVQIGGFDSTLIDFEIARKYGLNFTIADTTGPGGLFRALRTYPMLRGLCADMAKVCPRAVLLNYSNPLAMNMQTIFRTSDVRAVGLCHSVQGTLNQIMGYIGQSPDEVDFICAGINHMAFYLRLMKDGQDLYPRLFEAMRDPAVYGSNAVRFELMKRLGYFVTESSEHSAEYSAHFLAHGPEHAARYNVPIDEYLRRCDCSVDEFERLKQLSKTDAPVEVRRSHEYGSTIIHAMATGRPAVVYGNMPNHGVIANLPPDAIVETATVVDRAGLRQTKVGNLPPQLVGYMNPHITQHELFIQAAITGCRDTVYQAAMFDPLTAALLTIDQIVSLCDELIEAHGFVGQGGFLPPLQSKRTAVAVNPAPARSKKVDVAALRSAWKASRRASFAEHIQRWHVIGPFPAGDHNQRGLDLQTPIEQELTAKADGAIALGKVHAVGDRQLKWTAATADERGFVDLSHAVGQVEWAVAYSYARVDSASAREVILRCASDDGIKLWVNGALVLHHEVGRAYRADSDRAVARLAAGTNHILVKIDNYTGGWGFGVAIPAEAR